MTDTTKKLTASLSDFLLANPVDSLKAYVTLPRFEKAGFKFKIRPVSGDELVDYRQQATLPGSNDSDGQRANELVVINCVIDPDLTSEDFAKSVGCTTSEEVLHRFFKAGEISKLASYILEFSGFDASESAAIEEVKD